MITNGLVTATIAESASLSGEINLKGGRLFAIVMPAAWTTANLTFQAATLQGGTYNDVYDEDGTEVAVTAAASRLIILEPARWLGVRNLKVRSGTTGTPVNQAAARSVILITVDG